MVYTTLTPQLGEIRLAWWRERLQDLDRGIGPPAEPRLQAVAETLIPVGITGGELSRLEDCWLVLLNPFPWGGAEADAIAERGAILFGAGARLLGQEAEEAKRLGEIWSLAHAAKGVSDAASREVLCHRAKSAIANLPDKPIPSGLKPLAMIAARRTYDLMHDRRSKWHRVFWALRYGMTDKFPRS